MESMKATEVFFCHTFLLFRDNRVFISFVSLRDRDKAIRRHLRKEVEMCGDGWKTENGVLLFIYTPVITVSLASNSSTNLPLVACYHYPLSHCCSFGAVFALISFSGMAGDCWVSNRGNDRTEGFPGEDTDWAGCDGAMYDLGRNQARLAGASVGYRVWVGWDFT